MDEILLVYAESRHPREIVRMMLAKDILVSMIDTPVHGVNGREAKQLKVDAAFEYADMLMKG